MAGEPIERIYTLQEISETFKVSEKTLVRQIKAGWLKAFKVARLWRVTDEAYQQYKAEREPKFKRK